MCTKVQNKSNTTLNEQRFQRYKMSEKHFWKFLKSLELYLPEKRAQLR